MSENWLSTNAERDLVNCLLELDLKLGLIKVGKVRQWKWGIIALANALNSAMVGFLSGTVKTGALTAENAKRILAYHNDLNTNNFPEKADFLAGPPLLLQRCIGAANRFDTRETTIAVTSEEKLSFERLFQFRNEFLHFKPVSWSIETSGLPNIAIDCISIIEKLIEDNWSFRHASDELIGERDRAIVSIRNALSEI